MSALPPTALEGVTEEVDEDTTTTAPNLAELAAHRAHMEEPFTPDELIELIKSTPTRKAVVGPLAPWLLRLTSEQLAPSLAAELNSWRRVGRLPSSEARSAIALVPKSASASKPADLRGIAVGALLAKLYACGLERRVTEHAEAAGMHAEGQFGFRRQRSTEQAIFALRTITESTRIRHRRRRRGQPSHQLWACFVDFKQAYDTVPRMQLWAQLEQMGYGGEWLRSVQAIYADVPMSVNVPGLEGRLIHTTQGLKQGCPLSPTLFSLYIADFEQRVLSAAQHGEALDLPMLAQRLLPPLMYADDMALLATSSAGLQRQLAILQQFCAERGLTVNLDKTRLVLLAGAASPDDALCRVQRAGIKYAGQRIPGATEFKYLGAIFHCTQPLGESAAAGRAAVARFAAASFEGRCAELGLEAARLLLLLYQQLVDSSLSYGAAVWGPGLAATAAQRRISGDSKGISAAELQHHRTLRRLLGLPCRAPTATVLAEAGQPPLYISWLVQAARFWDSLLKAPEGSITQQVLTASLEMAADTAGISAAQLPWAAQLQQAMTAAGVAFDAQQRLPLGPEVVRQTALAAYLNRVAAAAAAPGASRLHHYFLVVRPSCLSTDGYGLATHITEVRERHRRVALSELRSGVHWGAEEQERLRGTNRLPPEQRYCKSCETAGRPQLVEDTMHMIYDCQQYNDLRAFYPMLFPQPPLAPTPRCLQTFFSGPTVELASFAGACRRRGRRNAGLPP